MAVKIRLKRMGMKKKPFYRVVVADIRSPRDGRFIEEIGYYNPMTQPAEIKVDGERAKYWLTCGAQPTDTVRVLLKKTGGIEKYGDSVPFLLNGGLIVRRHDRLSLCASWAERTTHARIAHLCGEVSGGSSRPGRRSRNRGRGYHPGTQRC